MTDALSGVALSTCPSAQGRGYEFDFTATNVLTANAEDYAENASAASSSFDVDVTLESIGELVEEFIQKEPAAKQVLRKLDKIDSEQKPAKKDRLILALNGYLQKLVDKNLLDEQEQAILVNLLGLLYDS